MNISHKKKYLYFVIPKCASKTIRHSISEYTDIGYPKSGFKQHMSLPEFLDSEYANLIDSYFKFTFVRNPYDRLYSGFQQDVLASKIYKPWIAVKEPIFREIGENFNRYICDYVQHNEINTDWRWICFCPMIEFTHFEHKYRLDWFGRVENINADLSFLAERLELDFKKAPNMNVNVQPSATLKYLNQYERRTIEIVNELYRDDFEYFGYKLLNPREFPVSVV